MKLSNKSILIISPEPWGSNHVSKHHYALALSKNNLVYFLNPPKNNFELAEIKKNLYVINYKSGIRGLAWLPELFSGFFIKTEIKKIENFIEKEFDIIWNFDSSRFFNLHFLKKKLRITHIVDWSENFNRGLLCKTSDICFCTTEYLKNDMQKFNSKTYNVGHGYNDSNYNLIQSEKEEINDNYTVKVGYVGNLNLQYIDWDIIKELIMNNSDCGFYFIGPEGQSNLSKNFTQNKILEPIKKFKNTYFLGEKPGYKIPAYLKLFDILLLVYKSHSHRKQLANPHKLLEYLGSGNVVFATWTEEYKDKSDLLEMFTDSADYLKKFEEIVHNLTFYNSRDKKNNRKSYSRNNTYEIRIQEIEKLINEHINKNIK